MHAEAYDYVARTLTGRVLPVGLTVEFGGRNINGTIRQLFAAPYVSVDAVPGPGVDVVANAATYEAPQPAACVVCCEVLEHTDEAEAICYNAHHLLEPGGVFLVTAAGEERVPHSAIDGGPLRAGEYYRNVSRGDLAMWLEAFADVTITENGSAGDIYAVAVKA